MGEAVEGREVKHGNSESGVSMEDEDKRGKTGSGGCTVKVQRRSWWWAPHEITKI